MAKVFLDANIYIDLVEKRKTPKINVNSLDGYSLFISPLSTHILCYSYRHKIPYDKLLKIQDEFEIVSFDKNIHNKSLGGPTPDFEDNIQLHSAIKAECDYFLTNDKNLLKMKFFGKTRITNSLN